MQDKGFCTRFNMYITAGLRTQSAPALSESQLLERQGIPTLATYPGTTWHCFASVLRQPMVKPYPHTERVGILSSVIQWDNPFKIHTPPVEDFS